MLPGPGGPAAWGFCGQGLGECKESKRQTLVVKMVSPGLGKWGRDFHRRISPIFRRKEHLRGFGKFPHVENFFAGFVGGVLVELSL